MLHMFCLAASRTSKLSFLNAVFYHFRTYDTRRDSYNGVTDEHHHRKQGLANAGSRNRVAVTYSSHGNDAAVDAVKNGVNIRIIIATLNNPENAAHTDVQNEDEEEKHENLVHTLLQRDEQFVTFFQEVQHSENTEYADNSERSQTYVVAKWNDAEKVYYSEETKCVFFWVWVAVDTQNIFADEEQLKQYLHANEDVVNPIISLDEVLHKTVKDYEENTYSNEYEEDDVKAFSGRSVSTKDYLVNLVLQCLIFFQLLNLTFY